MIRILIVDDEDGVRRVYKTLLENEGYDVLEAADAIEASYELNKSPIDIMLLDIKMPQVYGSMFYDTMQMFHKNVKVIVASVYTIEEQKKMVQGAADYYDKSQGLDLLLDKIKKVEQSIRELKNILIIDDEPGIRKIYRHYLQEYGYRIMEAHSGSLGLEVLKKNSSIPLVILDLAMPEESGLVVYNRIKKDFPEVKVLVASVFTKKDQERFLHDADGYYDKSEDAAGLINKIEELIK